MNKTLLITAIALVSCLAAASLAQAQVAGSSTATGVTVTSDTELAMGWSAKKSILGKTVYNDAGVKVGKVEDLIIAPGKSVSYLIVGAGGFVGIGRHDVAVPATEIRLQAGRLLMSGATKDTIKGMPEFNYAPDTAQRDRMVADAEQDIAKAKARLAELETRAATAAADAKAKLASQIADLQRDLQPAEAKLADFKRASAQQWRTLQADVVAAMARLRRSLDSAKG
jgi:hypothetical protein